MEEGGRIQGSFHPLLPSYLRFHILSPDSQESVAAPCLLDFWVVIDHSNVIICALSMIRQGMMGFKENLQEKINIDELAKGIRKTIGPSDGTLRLDTGIMTRLLELGGYPSHKERDLTLYTLEGDIDHGRFLVLDNDLAIYQTSAADIGLRKSPTVKEMVTFRNIKKILVDTDVVLSRKEESLNTIQRELIDRLDLHFETSDIETIAGDGLAAFERGDHDQVLESLALFSELLSFSPAPSPFRIKGFEIIGKIAKEDDGEIRFGPIVLYSPLQNTIKYIDYPMGSYDKAKIEHLNRIAQGEDEASEEGRGVFQILKTTVLK